MQFPLQLVKEQANSKYQKICPTIGCGHLKKERLPEVSSFLWPTRKLHTCLKPQLASREKIISKLKGMLSSKQNYSLKCSSERTQGFRHTDIARSFCKFYYHRPTTRDKMRQQRTWTYIPICDIFQEPESKAIATASVPGSVKASVGLSCSLFAYVTTLAYKLP